MRDLDLNRTCWRNLGKSHYPLVYSSYFYLPHSVSDENSLGKIVTAETGLVKYLVTTASNRSLAVQIVARGPDVAQTHGQPGPCYDHLLMLKRFP